MFREILKAIETHLTTSPSRTEGISARRSRRFVPGQNLNGLEARLSLSGAGVSGGPVVIEAPMLMGSQITVTITNVGDDATSPSQINPDSGDAPTDPGATSPIIIDNPVSTDTPDPATSPTLLA